MDTTQLKKLRQSLPKKYAKTIAEKCSVTTDYVRKTLNGYRINNNVIDVAVELATEHKNKIDKRSKAIQEL